MTFSPLARRSVPHHNKHRGKGPVKRLVIHHWASTAGGDTHLMNPNSKASASYILYGTGELVGQVPEEFRPWTTGPVGDAGSVTVETQNSTGAPEWKVSNAAVEKLAQLAADLSNRYGWGPLNRTNVRGHREFIATSCPGPYLYPRLDAIIARANQIRAGKPAPKPKPKPKPKPTRDIAREVIAGKWGNGPERKRSLTAAGYDYAAVQAEVNRRLR